MLLWSVVLDNATYIYYDSNTPLKSINNGPEIVNPYALWIVIAQAVSNGILASNTIYPKSWGFLSYVILNINLSIFTDTLSLLSY